MSITVRFVYLPGLKREVFHNVRLLGSWDTNGRYSSEWTGIPMAAEQADDGTTCYTANVEFDNSQVGQEFHWGVSLDAPNGLNQWGITTEVNTTGSQQRYRTFVLSQSSTQQQRYYLTHMKWLGANTCVIPGESEPGIRFAVWAPNAENVEVVFGDESGYIANDGFGMDTRETLAPIAMTKGDNGVWETEVLPGFSKYDHTPYMYRITKDDGSIAYRTDLYSRCQIGSGTFDPQGDHYTGTITELDGTKSCSVVVDPEMIAKNFKEDVWPEHEFVPEEEFWIDEFTPGRPLPQRVEDLVIYELHIGALGFGKNRPGTFEDAIELLDYLSDLGVNAVELLPISEFEGWAQWGYGTSHYFALEYSAGGRDQFKHFIRECHRRGIAVIMDVVYNHYHHNSERAEWTYDSDDPEKNIYFWYEGQPSDYPEFNRARPDQSGHGGYIDNMSTGYAPRYYEEMVRKMFISSAVALIENFHIDGFRLDQTTSIHSYNVIHANGSTASNANIFGAKFLREFSRTLKMIKPTVILTAEDHSNWDMVTVSPSQGGLGFDAVWYADFYHHLAGDTCRGPDYANLIVSAGYGQNQPLAMDYFAGALSYSSQRKVVYHESHDEAGNSECSRRTIVAAVNSAPLVGETRRVAEARCRFACGMSLLSGGTPMFLMGEEVGAQKDYRYNDFIDNREDLYGQRLGEGAQLFRFYHDIISFRLNNPGLRSHDIDIICTHNANRIIAFRRWGDGEEFVVVASLNNNPFEAGYTIENYRISDGQWQEVFNSDAGDYGGNNVGNYGVVIPASQGRVTVVIPANGFVVIHKID
jgi:1,4-alpha-glucan branching enzyme